MEIIFNIVLVLARFMNFLTGPIYTLIYRGKKEVVPPVRDPLLKIPAIELARRIRSKEISSEELCKAYIRRIKEVNPIINAIVEDRFEEAIKDAKAVDEYLKTTSLSELEIEKIKPLLGVPMTIKESCSVKGMSTSVGIVSRIGMKAERDGEAVAILRSSGAILLLVSTTPEFCLSWETYNFITGCTRNPYDSTRTSAGSSGGEGALLGSGASVVGLGSDIAGSIRLPAMFNGVFGHKPTPQVTSIKDHYPGCKDERYCLYLVTGPMARYSCDLKFIFKILVGNKMSSELKLDEPVNLRDLKVFYMVDFGSGLTQFPVESSIKNAIKEAATHLTTTCGATLDEYKFWHFKDAITVCVSTVINMRDVPNSLKLVKANLAVELIKSICGLSKFSLNILFFNCLRLMYKYVISDYVVKNEMWQTAITEKLGENGVLILPSFVASAQRHHQFYFKPAFGYLIIANALGLPSTSVPCGLDHHDMPIGFQVMAAPGQDRLCLAVAEELERYFGGWVPPNELTIKVFGGDKSDQQEKY
ncbi:fatty-acid amide hydrolase 2-B-like isoform X2 [Cylas formicarius]|uniref:fatty-acid amide hydrolase 2-B-like isoform X2 n=1 Tax=Cylas formicarius TaxID=197179 RepID=UPI002958CEEC|nr:fatty-acid amide hydrolase 2-B-like isoform X2 [Cylas formicarius]